MPFAAYLSTPTVSKSLLWTAHTRSPAHALVAKEPTPAMGLGTAIHCAVLEPDQFRRYVRGPDDRRGKRWTDALDEHGDALLTSGDYDAAVGVRDALRVHAKGSTAARLIASCTDREVSLFWRDPATDLDCRARPDAWTGNGVIVDLKTTADARPGAFQRAVANFGYHLQDAFYRLGATLAGYDARAFVFVVVETSPPYGVALYQLSDDWVRRGAAIAEAAMREIEQCRRTDTYPGYPDVLQTLAMPRWVDHQATEHHDDE
jgi:exodeoxyribonuclease VIII